MKKKILSLVLAGVMVLSAGSVAQAATTVSETDGVYSTLHLQLEQTNMNQNGISDCPQQKWV